MFDKYKNAMSDLSEVQNNLNNLWRKLSAVGLDKLANEIIDTVDILHKARKAIKEHTKEELDKSLGLAQQNSINVLNATLAGIKIGEKE